MTDSKTREGNTHDIPGPPYSASKLGCAKNNQTKKTRMKQNSTITQVYQRNTATNSERAPNRGAWVA